MGERLTKAQTDALSFVGHGGELREAYIKAMVGTSVTTLNSLWRRGLLNRFTSANGHMWAITPADRSSCEHPMRGDVLILAGEGER
jgi:hypothetical protein